MLISVVGKSFYHFYLICWQTSPRETDNRRGRSSSSQDQDHRDPFLACHRLPDRLTIYLKFLSNTHQLHRKTQWVVQCTYQGNSLNNWASDVPAAPVLTSSAWQKRGSLEGLDLIRWGDWTTGVGGSLFWSALRDCLDRRIFLLPALFLPLAGVTGELSQHDD